MNSLSVLPGELVERILEHLDVASLTGKQALRNLALTHSTLRPYAQAQIFHHVALNFSWHDFNYVNVETRHVWDPEKARPTPSTVLTEVLQVSPQIGTYVKALYLQNGAFTDKSTITVISMLSSVQKLFIAAPFTMRWDEAQQEVHDWDKSEIQDVLADTVLPTISILTVMNFHSFPFHKVIPLCLNLEELTICNNPCSLSGPLGTVGPISSTLPFPPLKKLCFFGPNISGRPLLKVIERARSTLKVLQLNSRLSVPWDNDMLYEQNLMRLVGAHLSSIDLSWPHFSQHGPPGWDSDAFHLSALPSLEKFKINTTSEFCREIDAPLQWVLPRLSVGTSVNHPLSTFCISFYAGQPPTQVTSQTSSNLWLQLDKTLTSFQHLTKVWLLGKLGTANLEARNVWKQQEVSLRPLFPSMAKRNNVLDFDDGV